MTATLPMATHSAHEPGRATGPAPGPVLLEVVLAGLDVAARDEDDEPDETVEDGVDEDTTVTNVSVDVMKRVIGLTR
jgi:hypothetical protein